MSEADTYKRVPLETRHFTEPYFRVPKSVREEYDIIGGRVVPVIIHLEDGDEQVRLRATSRGRLTIAKDVRDELGIEDGDLLDVTLLIEQHDPYA